MAVRVDLASNSFVKAELSPERYWCEPKSKEVRGMGCGGQTTPNATRTVTTRLIPNQDGQAVWASRCNVSLIVEGGKLDLFIDVSHFAVSANCGGRANATADVKKKR